VHEPGTPLWHLARLHAALDARRPTIDRYAAYYEGHHPMAFASAKFRAAFGSLFSTFADNWCELVVDAVKERLHVEGFRFGADTGADAAAWDIWQRNQLDADSSIAHTEALISGICYVMVWADDMGEPAITVEHPAQVIVSYAPANRRRRTAALKVWLDDEGYTLATLYLPTEVYKYRSSAKRLGTAPIQWVPRDTPGESWPITNPLGVVPIVALPNRARLLIEHRSEIASVLPVQDAVNKLVADMMVASEFAAFRQRWATGLEIPTDPVTGKPVEPFRAAVDRMWMANPPKDKIGQPIGEVRFGEFGISDLEPYTRAVELLVQHIASQTRTPPHYFYLSGQFPSGEPVATREPLLTANRGWQTMESIRSGDRVYGVAGEPIEVLDVHPVHVGRRCYRVVFDDGSSVVTDAGHRWRTHSIVGTQTSAACQARTLTTDEIARTLRLPNAGNGRNRDGKGCARHAVRLAAALVGPDIGLPVHPWMLGYWLGNGGRGSGQVACDVRDTDWLMARIDLAGLRASTSRVANSANGAVITVHGLRRAIGDLGLHAAKHIPEIYSQAGPKQRLHLLQGILDADGSPDHQGRATIDLNDERLALDVHSLAVGLGQKVRLRSGAASSVVPDGRRYHYTRWRLAWTPSIEAFSMPRKLERLRLTDSGRARLRYIVAVEPVPAEPVRCITVDSPDHLFLVGRSLVPTHNSIRAAEAGLVAKAHDKMKSFGEGWEEVVRLALAIAGNASAAAVTRSEVIWRDPEVKVESELIDSLTKQQALGVPNEVLWERAGYSPTEIERIKAIWAALRSDPSMRVPPDPMAA